MALQSDTSSTAGHHHHDHSKNRPPKAFLIGCGLLVLFALVGTTVSKLTGYGQFTSRDFEMVAARSLTFADREDGGIIARDPTTGDIAKEWAPGEGNFVRTALRALSYNRQKTGVGASEPFQLARSAEGVMFLTDPVTGKQVVLNAFSNANAAEFAVLLPERDMVLSEGAE